MRKVVALFLVISILGFSPQKSFAGDCFDSVVSSVETGSGAIAAWAVCVAAVAGEIPTVGADTPVTWLSCAAAGGFTAATVMKIYKAYKDCVKDEDEKKGNGDPNHPPQG